MTSLNTSTGGSDYASVRFSVSTVSFSALLFFNLIITWTIVSEPCLRRHARFVLLLQLLLSALLHLGTSSLFYLLIHLRARPVRAACLAMISVLISSASNILLTLTVMALDRFCAVCHPLRYSGAPCAGRWPWILGLITWVVSLLIPVTVLHQEQENHQAPGECGGQQLRKGELQKVVFITVCALIILYSYTRILMEGRKLGLLTRHNQAGCRTIALHFAQLTVYILPNFVNFALTSLNKRGVIQRDAKELWAVVSFTFFSLAQCVAPVVYGLRKEELLEKLGHRFPCCVWYLKRVLGWTHKHHPSRERRLTGQTIVSLEVPQIREQEET
ncbi:olfactory receptor 14A16 [Gouania willdenowi]|uniref:Olfactory receptor 14A16-like n=1 Tax=Gouania willdenowi TaxID=441366 RepID=A0A8C5GBG2_GOUWI|nr:olfactory receptor 14A16-like [Gouania willdenowi]